MIKITEKSEAGFLSFTKGLNKQNSSNQVIIRYGLSKFINRESLVNDIPTLEDKLKGHKAASEKVFNIVYGQMKGFANSSIYLFTDTDIIVVARFDNQEAFEEINECYKKVTACFPTGMTEFLMLGENISYCKNIALERHRNTEIIAAYHKMTAAVAANQNYEALRKGRVKPFVLVAEADPDSAEAIKRILAKDYRVSVALTGPAAIEKYVEEAPDCVVMDLNMPILNGMEVSVCIKSFDINAFIVMMSTDPIQKSIIDSFNSGAGDFIKKPLSQGRLFKAVQKSPYISGEKIETIQEMQDSEEVFVF